MNFCSIAGRIDYIFEDKFVSIGEKRFLLYCSQWIEHHTQFVERNWNLKKS